jgi:hypothetical protein
MLTLTPLAEIAAFNQAIRDKLAPYWITTAQEFITTSRASNQQLGSGLAALAEVLDIPQSEVSTLVQAATSALSTDVTLGAGPRLSVELGTGAIFEDMHLPEAIPFDLPLHLPSEVNLTEALAPPRQQGKRDTCLAFSLVALYQQASMDNTDLSEQFLYWACKERDGMPHVRGTRPDVALDVLREMGICTEAIWPYQPQPIADNEGQGPPPDRALQKALHRRITSYNVLPPGDIRQMQSMLARGNALLIGLPIYEHWTTTWQARTLGRVRRALPGEAERSGHAMALMGYRDDATAPGGGYFIVRNSWGTAWGTQNLDGPGYCHIPYQVMHEQNLVSCVINGIIAAPGERPQDTDAYVPAQELSIANAPTRAEPLMNRAQETTPAASLPAKTQKELDREMQALYSEARAIRDRLNMLVERLAAMAERIRSD